MSTFVLKVTTSTSPRLVVLVCDEVVQRSPYFHLGFD